MPESLVTRICCYCKVEKPLQEFHRTKRRLGYRYDCRSCFAKYKREWRKKNPQTLSPEARKRRREIVKAYQQRMKGNPEYVAQCKAKNAVSTAIHRKKLIRPSTCERCGNSPVEAHHYKGYEREHWFDIQWLCKECHTTIHRLPLEMAHSVVLVLDEAGLS